MERSIFKRINHYLETGKKLDDETLKNRIDVFFEILELCKKYDYLEIKPIKIFAFNSVKGFHKSKDIKRKLALCKTIKELEELLFNYN